jgi:hydroxymethylpyrimidine pyrophosphatase-like HAD family hydrolase
VYCRVIACDFDGTGATDGHPAPELYAALAAARGHGIVTLLVTGRVLEDVQRACEELSPHSMQ